MTNCPLCRSGILQLLHPQTPMAAVSCKVAFCNFIFLEKRRQLLPLLQSTIGGKSATDYPEVNLPQGMAAARGSKHPSKGGSKHPSKKRL